MAEPGCNNIDDPAAIYRQRASEAAQPPYLFCSAGRRKGIRVHGNLYWTGCRKQKVHHGRVEQRLKTANGYRQVDLHPVIAELLKQFVDNRKASFLFQTRKRKPFSPTNIIRRHLHKALEELKYVNPYTGTHKAGNHAFRRFRNTYLRNYTECPEGLYKYWMGHAGKDMSDLYDKIKEDVAFRRRWAERCGFGFELPSVVPNVPKTAEKTEARKRHKSMRLREKEWSGREDLNLRPPGPELTICCRVNNLRFSTSGASTVQVLLVLSRCSDLFSNGNPGMGTLR